MNTPQTIHTEPAPMAGYTDLAFRRVLLHCGLQVVWTEMISVTALFHRNAKTIDMLGLNECTQGELAQTVVQLFGKNPEHYRAVLASGILDGFREININMGCPARKITANGDGCALMNNPALAERIIRACVSSTKTPISVKMRLGVDGGLHGQPTPCEECTPYCHSVTPTTAHLTTTSCKTTPNPVTTTITCQIPAVSFAQMCENAGASRLIVHGRFGSQGYSGTANHHAIAEVVRAVSIPVLANGDIINEKTARECLEVTRANGVMMGRALIGAPWQITMYKLQITNIREIIKYHLDTAEQLYGERGILDMRKHLLAYANHFPNPKDLKKRLCIVSSFAEGRTCLGL